MPHKFNLPLTYAPKIAGVQDGTIRQTIRTGRKFAVGDLVSFHGWSGRPYFSKWSFRTPYFPLVEVLDIFIEPGGLRREGQSVVKWTEPIMDSIARMDGIVPPTGAALAAVLTGLNKIPDGQGVEAQIIRWAPHSPDGSCWRR